MSVIILLIVFSLIVAIVFLGAFIWSVKSGQFEDTLSPSIRILFDENKSKKTSAGNSKNSAKDDDDSIEKGSTNKTKK